MFEFCILNFEFPKGVKGSAQIFRGQNKSVETLKAGEKTLLSAGDSVVEPEGMIHFGSNNENTPLVLLGATLFLSEPPPSQVMEDSESSSSKSKVSETNK